MGTRGYSANYRTRRRQRHISGIIIVAAAVLLFLVILFLVLGNSLKDRSDGDNESKETEASTDIGRDSHKPTVSVSADPLDISGNTQEISNRLKTIAEAGATAVSVNLCDKNGALLYSSELAKKLDFDTSGSVNMAEVASKVHAREMYLSAYFGLQSIKEESGVRFVKMSYEMALAAELCSLGADDVLVSAGGADLFTVDEMVRFAEGVRTLNSDAVIGIALSREMLSSESAATAIAELHDAYDFIALDLTDLGADDTVNELEKTLEAQLYYVLRYNVRVVLSQPANAESADDIAAVLSENSVGNVQYVIK